MCAAIGLNVRRDGSDSLDIVQSMHATWIRIVATPDNDLTDYLTRCKAAGIRVLLVLARESFTDLNILASYRDRYGSLVTAIQVGNEADIESPSSWTMTPGALAALGKSVRAMFPTTPLVCAGMVSGQPDWLRDADLSWCDAVAVHPYLRDAPNPSDLEDLPDIDVLVRAYQQYGKPVLVTEWGWWGNDETRAVEEVGDAIKWAAATKDCAVFFYFALGDDVQPFGLYGQDGRPKARAASFLNQAAKAVEVPWLPSAAPPVPPMTGAWRYWTAQQIADATACPVAAITEHWPRIYEQMRKCGETDRATQVAMLGIVAIETASTFEPVREAFWLDEAWRAANLRYYPFYGRGFIQLTWESNYRAYTDKLRALWGADAPSLIDTPDIALDPDVAAATAALYFRDTLVPAAAAAGNWTEVRRLVQGGNAGLDRLVAIAGALGAGAPVPPTIDPRDEQIAALTLALRTLRDTTLPAVQAQLDEAKRIAIQFAGQA